MKWRNDIAIAKNVSKADHQIKFTTFAALGENAFPIMQNQYKKKL